MILGGWVAIGGSAGGKVVEQVALDLVQSDSVLRHRVARPDRHRVVVEGLEVDRDAERRADLVLAAVAAADRAGVIELDVPSLPQSRGEVTRLRRQVLV